MAVDGWHTYRAQPVMRRDTLVEYVDNKDEQKIARADQVVWHFVKRWRTYKPSVDEVAQSK
jgi:hypothetical protein